MATTTRDAIEELLQTYGETGGINYLAAAASLPSRLSVEAACTELMSLMFPGFRSEALVSSEDLADTTRIRVRHLHARLKTEICRSLGKIPPDEATEAKAEEVLTEFFKQLPSVRRMLWTDIDAAYEGDPAATTLRGNYSRVSRAGGDRDLSNGTSALRKSAADSANYD